MDQDPGIKSLLAVYGDWRRQMRIN